jgi:hypothetical protein
MVTLEEARTFAETLPRTEVALVRARVKFRVRSLVYVAFSKDQTLMGFTFPKLEREALVQSEPDKFQLPEPADRRYNWCVVRLEAIDSAELREIIFHAWRMVVPKRVAAEHSDRSPVRTMA